MTNEEGYKQFRELISAIEKKLVVLEDGEFSCCGITLAQCHALVEIGRAGSISLNELADIINLESSTVSRTVNNLVNSGMVIRDSDRQDRRFIKIKLTQEGNELFKKIENGMDDYFKEIFSNIPQEKREQVIESLLLTIEAINKSNCCPGECSCAETHRCN